VRVTDAIAGRWRKVEYHICLAGKPVQTGGVAQITADGMNAKRTGNSGASGTAYQSADRIVAGQAPRDALADVAKADDENSG